MASSVRPSAFTTGALGALASGTLTGAGDVTELILIEKFPQSHLPDYDGTQTNAL
jgi:hypothetical protein